MDTKQHEQDPAEPVSSASQMEQGRPKLVIELKELDDIYSRFKTIFVLTNLLTSLLAIYLIARLFFPQSYEVEALRRLQTIGLCGLVAGSALLCLAQWLCLRQTTRSSRRKIEELTFKDALTNVFNYRYLDRRLSEELRVSRRFHTTLSVVYMDLDNFKRVNDECGHQVGNTVLAEFGRFLRVAARVTDLVGRMGGDEFLIILPNADRNEAQIVSERIRARLEQHVFDIEDRKVDHLRVSMGVASFPYEAKDKEGLIAGADQAMYRAKQSGGNRVCI